jgi:hypothetical protein
MKMNIKHAVLLSFILLSSACSNSEQNQNNANSSLPAPTVKVAEQ